MDSPDGRSSTLWHRVSASDRHALVLIGSQAVATGHARMSGIVGIGIALEVLAGAMLSLSLVIQRHALIHSEGDDSEDNTVPLGC